MNIPKFKALKGSRKISMVTCYDASFAEVLEETDVDAVLVGDSVAMVIYGYDSTVHADVDMIERHVRAVRTKYTGLIVADIPFLTAQKSQTDFISDVTKLVQAGAQAVKLEGVSGVEDKIKSLIAAGVPVMGHVGLTPQFVNEFGGFKVQGRTDETRKKISEEAKVLENLGCFSVVLECVPEDLAKEVTQNLSAPTVGIGAGKNTDGQILVLQDLLGLNKNKFKFVKKYENFFEKSVLALSTYVKESQSGDFPTEEHVFL